MTDKYLEVEYLSKRFDGIKALTDFSCFVCAGEIVGLIGSNGAGKSTLFNLITGFISPDGGQIAFCGKKLLGLPPHKISNLGIARTFQKLRLIRRLSVLDNILLAFKNQPGERLKDVFFRWKAAGSTELENRTKALSLLEEFGIADKYNVPAEALSYGQQKLVTLACCFVTDARLILLDEPIAGIAPLLGESILSIIRGLPETGKSVIIIEHNIDAITQICNRVIVMDSGRKIAEGSPMQIRNDPKVIEAYLD